MRVIIGGAYNGKRKYVKENLLGQKEFRWFEGELPNSEAENIVVAGLEQWLMQFEGEEERAIQLVVESLMNRNSIVILTDINRGIVPIERKDRELRDRCGRLYQRLMEEAEEVIQIWYGLPKIIKERKK